MPHCDPETIALRALGEVVPAQDETHLVTCPTCQGEVEELRAVIGVARGVTAEDTPTAPPDRVWEAIAGELDLRASAPVAVGAAASAVSMGADGTGVAEVEPLIRRRDRRALYLVGVAAAAVGLVVGAFGVALAGRSDTGDVVARTTLEPVDATSAHGTAILRSTDTGRLLDVDLTDLPEGDGYFEVWFMNADTGGSVSLGALGAGRETTFAVPAGLRLEDFPYVDVSLEPLDGDPGHSSDSVARGRLAPAGTGGSQSRVGALAN